jgi:hypothetical protein
MCVSREDETYSRHSGESRGPVQLTLACRELIRVTAGAKSTFSELGYHYTCCRPEERDPLLKP